MASGYYRFSNSEGHWRLDVVAQNLPDTLKVTLSRRVTGGLETHVWEIPKLSSGGITPESSGAVTIAPPKASTSPLMRIDLSFTPTSTTNVTCVSGTETKYVGQLTGVLKLATGLKNMGTVGGTSISFGQTRSVVDNGCVLAEHNCKHPGITWTAEANKWMFGFSNGAGDSFAILRSVNLTAPKGATRSDGAAALEPALTLKKGRTLNITTTSGTPISGSAILTAAGTPSIKYGTCYENGVEHTSVAETWVFATLTKSSLVGVTKFGHVASQSDGFGTIGEYAVK